MLMRIRILFFLAVIVFAVFSACKMFRKYDASNNSKSVASSVVPSSVPATSKNQDESEIRRVSPFVDCSSWGSSPGSFWAYGDGLMFEGLPDGWANGSPKYLRIRGKPL